MTAALPRTRSLSLRTKWTLALLLTGAVPLGLFAYTTVSIQKRGLERAEREIEVAVIGEVARIVDRTLDDAEEATHRVGRVLFEPAIAQEEARVQLARESMARGEALLEVAVYRPDGALVDAIRRKEAPADAPASLDHLAPEVLAVESDAGQWLAPEYGARGAVVRFVEPVLRDHARVAWVVGTLRPDALDDEMQTLSMNQFDGRRDGVLLLDRAQRLLAGGSGAFTLGASLSGKDVFAGRALGPDPFGRQLALSGEFVSGSGEPMVGFAQTLDPRPWAVVVRRPVSSVYEALGDARRWMLRFAAGFALLAIAIGAWLAAATTRPVRTLVELARAYARREFGARSKVHTGDELEALGASMSEMADDIVKGEAEILRRSQVEAGLSRYLPSEVAKAIAAGKRDLALGGERRAISVLFADVVAFTPFAERSEPERVVAFLNELFTVLTEIVFRHGGTVDKFVGDAVMAIFGAPSDLPEHAARAIAAAEDMHRFVEASASTWKKKYGIDAKLAIGIACGDALVGNLGSETRMEYTAVGDVVNVAARLEAIARPAQTLVTAEVAARAGDEFSFTDLGDHPLRGKAQSVSIKEVA